MHKRQRHLRLPDFLIIGAMKAGTTSLSRDLQANPDIHFPSVKEPHFLANDNVLTSAGRSRYEKLFSRARDSQRRGEASTGYTKLPSIQGVPRRARQLLGRDAKCIYLVRDPIDRAISHHFHMYRSGDLSIGIDQASRCIPDLVNYGSYAMQLKSWQQEFDANNFHIVRFEDYIASRRDVVADVCRFLNIEPQTQSLDPDVVHNDGQSAATPIPLFRSLVRGVTRSQWYKLHVHPRTPQRLREVLKPAVMRKTHTRPPPPSEDTLKYLADRFRADAEQLRLMTNRQQPLWDLDAPRDRTSDPASQLHHGETECKSFAH
jgi:hypothetical protein